MALYPDTRRYFSNSAVVDILIWITIGEEKTLLAYLHMLVQRTGTDLAYSNDKGKTWTKYANNPILTHFENDPDFRDPKGVLAC